MVGSSMNYEGPVVIAARTGIEMRSRPGLQQQPGQTQDVNGRLSEVSREGQLEGRECLSCEVEERRESAAEWIDLL